MRSFFLASLAALTSIAAAQSSSSNPLGLPTCALPCMEQAIGNTTCSLTDYYCQCTTGKEKIQELGVMCLCGSSCTTSDLLGT